MPWVFLTDEQGHTDYSFQPEYFEDADDAHQCASDLRNASGGKDYYIVVDDETV